MQETQEIVKKQCNSKKAMKWISPLPVAMKFYSCIDVSGINCSNYSPPESFPRLRVKQDRGIVILSPQTHSATSHCRRAKSSKHSSPQALVKVPLKELKKAKNAEYEEGDRDKSQRE